MAVVTDLVAGTGVGGVQEAAGANYKLEEYTRALPNGTTEYCSRYWKYVSAANQAVTRVEAFGVSTVDQATARANALNSLNATRRHRYAGAPGKPSGSTVITHPTGNTPTADSN